MVAAFIINHININSTLYLVQYFSIVLFYSIFGQINAALVSRKYFFYKI